MHNLIDIYCSIICLGFHLGLCPAFLSLQVQQPLERMQHFLAMMHDNCYHILGNAGPSLGLQFYQHPHLTDYIIHSSLANLALIPDYRLRRIVRTFLKPFIQWCPPQCYQTVLLPILNHLCPYSKFTYYLNFKSIILWFYEDLLIHTTILYNLIII